MENILSEAFPQMRVYSKTGAAAAPVRRYKCIRAETNRALMNKTNFFSPRVFSLPSLATLARVSVSNISLKCSHLFPQYTSTIFALLCTFYFSHLFFFNFIFGCYALLHFAPSLLALAGLL